LDKKNCYNFGGEKLGCEKHSVSTILSYIAVTNSLNFVIILSLKSHIFLQISHIWPQFNATLVTIFLSMTNLKGDSKPTAYSKTSIKCPRRLLEHGPRNPGV